MTYLRSRRCEQCDANWPVAGSFHKCPLCKQPTWEHDEKPMTYNEANKLARERMESAKKHRAFEEYYADRAAKQLKDELKSR